MTQQQPSLWECGKPRSVRLSKLGGRGENAITKLTLPPSERHFHSEFANFRHLWRIFAF